MRLCEIIWVAADDVDQKLVVPLTHLLAAAVAVDTTRPVFVCIGVDQYSDALFWVNGNLGPKNGNFVDLGQNVVPMTSLTDIENATANLLTQVGLAAVHRYVFIVNPAQPRTAPKLGPRETLDRIVFLTDALHTVLPQDFAALLPVLARHANVPAFSSYIPSIIVRKPTAFSAIATAIQAALTWGEPDLEVRAIADDVPDDPSLPIFKEDEIISRDACTLGFDLAAVLSAWSAWPQVGSFFGYVGAKQRRAASAWGRAVTNRRVGIAVSGGGACGFRAGPLLEEMERQEVPVDAFAGLSGGALVAAYYCCEGQAGFNLAADLGWLFSLTMPIVYWTSWPLAFVTDVMLRGKRIEELPVRFVPVTTALPQGQPPFAAIVVGGTVGNGVRASGTLPPGFAPTRLNGTGYTDGASTAMMPLRILRDYGGADAVLACDINPGPARSNPFDGNPIGRFLHDYTLVGRFLDVFSTLAFFSQRATRSFSMTADAYVCFPPEIVPLFESVEFFNSWGIIERARDAQALLTNKVAKLKAKWQEL